MLRSSRRWILFSTATMLITLGVAPDVCAQRFGISVGTGRGGFGYGSGYGRGYYGGYGRGYYGGYPGAYGPYGYGRGYYGSGIGITLGPRIGSGYYGTAGYHRGPIYSGNAQSTVVVPSTSGYYSPGDSSFAAPARTNSASIEVRVPPDARVWFGMEEMAQTSGPVRLFHSPTLEPGYDYQYEVRAQWFEDGQTVERTRTVTIHAGERTVVDFMNAN